MQALNKFKVIREGLYQELNERLYELLEVYELLIESLKFEKTCSEPCRS